MLSTTFTSPLSATLEVLLVLSPPKLRANKAMPILLPSVPPLSAAKRMGSLLVSQGAAPPLASQVGSSTPPWPSLAERPAVMPRGTKPIG